MLTFTHAIVFVSNMARQSPSTAIPGVALRFESAEWTEFETRETRWPCILPMARSFSQGMASAGQCQLASR